MIIRYGLACAAMMLGMGLGCAGHPSPHANAPEAVQATGRFSYAEIKLVGGSTKRVDAATAERLASFFPDLGTGQRSKWAGSWVDTMTITFYQPDGTSLIVRTDGGAWRIDNPPRVEPEILTFLGPPGNPHGDFLVEGDLDGFVASLFTPSRPRGDVHEGRELPIGDPRVNHAEAQSLAAPIPKPSIQPTEDPALHRAERLAYKPPALQAVGALDRIVEALNSEKDYVRDANVDAILADRKALVERLIPLIDAANADKYSFHTRRVAAYLLGELRAEEAAPVLAKALVNAPVYGDNYYVGRYSGAVFCALVKIGRPTIPSLIQNLQTSDNQVVRFDSIMIMNQILGGNSHTLETLRKVRARADDPAEIRRLDAAIKQVEGYLKHAAERKEEEPLY